MNELYNYLSFFSDISKKIVVSALCRWIFTLGPNKVSALDSVRFTVSALERFFKVKMYRNRPGPNVGVRLNKVSALEHVRFSQVSLYYVKAVKPKEKS